MGKIFLISLVLLCGLPGGRARAAGSDAIENINAAYAEARYRYPDPVLVGIEGEAEPDGRITCEEGSYSRSWHIKYYSPKNEAWPVVAVCGGKVVSVQTEIPAFPSDAPTKDVGIKFINSTEAIDNLKNENDNFARQPESGDKPSVFMSLEYSPGEGKTGPELVWKIQAGGATVRVSAEPGKRLKKSKARLKPPGLKKTGKIITRDTAKYYMRMASDEVQKTFPGAKLLSISGLVDEAGVIQCIDVTDGWSYSYINPSAPGRRMARDVVACKGKVLTGADFDRIVELDKLAVLPGDFRDSNEIMETARRNDIKINSETRVMGSGGNNVASLKLRNFKPGMSPVPGQSFLWILEIGSRRYYFNPVTGFLLGGNK